MNSRVKIFFIVVAALIAVFGSHLPESIDTGSLVTILLCLFGSELYSIRKSSQNERDEKLFKDFKALLPSNGASVRFLKDWDIGNDFRQDHVINLFEYSDNWNTAEHEFQNKKLQKQMKITHDLAHTFVGNLVASVSGNGDFFSMGLRDMEDRPEKLKKKKELNEAATKVYEAHQELIRLGNRLL